MSGLPFPTPAVPTPQAVPTPPTRAPAHPRRQRLALGLLFLVLSLTMLRLTPARLTGSLPDNLGDPALIAWLMDWAGHSVVTDPAHYFDAPIFAPNTGTTAYTDSLLPQAAVFGPVHALAGSASWALAFNITLVALVMANLAATYALVRWLTGRADAALVAALGFVFSSFFLGHLGNTQLLAAWFLPAGFLLLFRVLIAARLRDGAALGVVTVGQVLAAAYFGVVWGLSAVLVVAGWFLVRRRVSWRQVRALGLAAIVAVALLVPLTAPYLALQSDPAFARPLFPRGSFEWVDLLIPIRGNPVWHVLFTTFGYRNEHTAFPGLLVTVLAAIGFLTVISRRAAAPDRPGSGSPSDRRLALLLLLVAGAVAAVLSSGPVIAGHPAPFAFFADHVPGFNGVRVPARLAVVAMLAAAVLAGVGWAALTGRLSARNRQLLTGLTCLVVLVEIGGPIPWATLPVDDRTLAVYRALDRLGPGTVIELPMPNPGSGEYPYVEAPRQLYATLDFHPRVNGYSGYSPPGYDADTRLFVYFPAPDTITRLGRLGVRWVVVHGGPQDGAGQYGPASRARILATLPAGFAITPIGDDLLLERDA